MRNLLQRYIKYEFWPFWLFYGFLTPVFLYYIFKTKAPAYFCNVNPKIRFGGFYDYPKMDLLEWISKDVLPQTDFISKEDIHQYSINSYPKVVKPNVGERGKNVQVLRSNEDWIFYRKEMTEDLLLQDFIDDPLEFGLFYVRYPKEENGKLISITAKEFLWITGDGKTTLRNFINQNPRIKSTRRELHKKFENRLDEILRFDEKLLLSEIGNHYRGTKFLDASDLITDQLSEKVDQLIKDIPHFYYGRLDVKTKSIEDLQNGKFVILEVNAANSEATQLYDPKYSVFDAWKIATNLLKIQYTVAKQNHELGFPYPKWQPLAKVLLQK